jgi:hypothetical protein
VEVEEEDGEEVEEEVDVSVVSDVGALGGHAPA